MSQVSFKPSLRYKKSRLARQLQPFITILGLVSLVLLGLSLYLAWNNNRLDAGSLALAILGLMVRWWYQGDLSHLNPGKVNEDLLELDQVLASDVLAGMRWPQTLQELWRLAEQTKAGQFMIKRLELDGANVITKLDGANTVSDQQWASARELQLQNGLVELDGACIVAALLLAYPEALAAGSQGTVQPADVTATLLWHAHHQQAEEAKTDQMKLSGIGRGWASGYTPILSQYSYNVSEQVERSPASYFNLARSQTLDQILAQISRQERPNIVLVGPVGSGKTSVIYALAERLLYVSQQRSSIPVVLRGLNPALITSSNQTPGEIEQLVLHLFADAVHAGNTMMFLDDAQLFLKTGVGALDLSQLLLSITQQSNIPIIMALTPGDYERLVTSNSALAGQFNVIKMPELDSEQVIALLQDRLVSLESDSHNQASYRALTEVYRLAERHITTEAFPGKAITLLEDSFRYAANGWVTAASVSQCLEQSLGIKAAPTTSQEKTELLNLEETLHHRMINQTRAVSVVAAALRRNRAGVGSPNRPAGSFLFLGPTGVGKTELAKALAAAYFGGVEHIIRLDMSEFQQPSDVSRILATAESGQSGTNLLLAVRQQPFSVVLLDELEKAHPEILNLLLQMLDEGHLTDSDGQPVSFTNCIIIATSNAGADDIRQHVEAGQELEQFEKQIVDGLISNHSFRPELINRFDAVVLFRPLTKPELAQVTALLLAEVNVTLANQNITVELTPAAINYLVEHGYDPQFGARPLRRLIQETVQNRVADGILRGDYHPGSQIKLDQSDLA